MLERRVLLIVLITIFLCAQTALAFVERDIGEAGADGLVTVRLLLSDGVIGGVSEEIPDGYVFVGTGHPAEQLRVEGGKIHFAVIGEKEIVYTLKGKGEVGKMDIRGKWIDLSQDAKEGDVTAAKERSLPGFTIPFGLAAFALLAYMRRGRR